MEYPTADGTSGGDSTDAAPCRGAVAEFESVWEQRMGRACGVAHIAGRRDRLVARGRDAAPAWVSCVALTALVTLVSADPCVADGITASLVPQQQTVAPGAEFELDFQVTVPNLGFNVWEGTLAFDPAALTYVPTVPVSAQQGCLMTGACSPSCGSLFLQVKPGPDSVYVGDGLLCYQIFLTEPGSLFRFRFKADATPRQTQVYFRNLVFSRAGLHLEPLTSYGASIGIGMPALGVEPPGRGPMLRLTSAPNPARGAVRFRLDAGSAGEQELLVHDLAGRTVRALGGGWQPAGGRDVVWDGMDSRGVRVGPGVYLVTLRVGDRRAYRRVALLD